MFCSPEWPNGLDAQGRGMCKLLQAVVEPTYSVEQLWYKAATPLPPTKLVFKVPIVTDVQEHI